LPGESKRLMIFLVTALSSSTPEAESKTYRNRVWEWFNDDLNTRLEPDASILLI